MLERVRHLTPRGRRWEALLRSLDADPVTEAPLEPIGPRDFLICGLPRSGTSLLCAALFQPPTCLTVMEPWDGLRLPPAELMRSLRQEIRGGILQRGRLDVRALARTGDVRWGRDGEHPVRIEGADDFELGVKWPAYWRYLPVLPSARFLVCLRHPAEVLTSFASMNGSLGDGLEYDVAFNREMNRALRAATDEPERRRLLLLEWISARIAPHLGDPNVLVVRYERWFRDRAGLMSDISAFLGVPLGSGLPVIRAPQGRSIDPGMLELIRQAAPSAASLGYEI